MRKISDAHIPTNAMRVPTSSPRETANRMAIRLNLPRIPALDNLLAAQPQVRIETITDPHKLIAIIKGNGHGDGGPRAKIRLISLLSRIDDVHLLFSMRELGWTVEQFQKIARRMAELDLEDSKMLRFVAFNCNDSDIIKRVMMDLDRLQEHRAMADLLVEANSFLATTSQPYWQAVSEFSLAKLENACAWIKDPQAILILTQHTMDESVMVTAAGRLAEHVESSSDIRLLMVVARNHQDPEVQKKAGAKLTALSSESILANINPDDVKTYAPVVCLACYSPEASVRMAAFEKLPGDYMETIAIISLYDDIAVAAVERVQKSARSGYEKALERIRNTAKSRKAREKALLQKPQTMSFDEHEEEWFAKGERSNTNS